MIEISQEISNKINGKEYKPNVYFNVIEQDGNLYISEQEYPFLVDFGIHIKIKLPLLGEA